MGSLFGSSNKASNAAQAEEDKRRAEIEATQRTVESIFGSSAREAQVQDLEDATREFLQDDLDREKGKNDRGLKFALARNGLSGGSTAIDQNRNLSEAYLRGLLQIERRAQGAGANLKAQDQEAKNTIFSQALSGLDSTTAAHNAASALSANVATAKTDALQGGFGDLFTSFNDIFKASAEQAGRRKAGEEFNTLFGQRPSVIAPVAGVAGAQ